MQIIPTKPLMTSLARIRRLASFRRPLRHVSLALALSTCLLTPVSSVTSHAGIPGRSASLTTSPLAIAQAHAAASPLHYRLGYSLQSGWLCFGWPNGAYHCTRHWYRTAAGVLMSANTAWVPNGLDVRLASVKRIVSKVVKSAATRFTALSALPRGISQWAYTGRSAWADGGLRGAYPAGQCTLYAWSRDTRLWGLGNAGMWAANARARGLPVSSTPYVGATVVFAGGVQGASSLGHVGHVEAVYPGGWFMLSEMNFSWNGGGWGRVDYRYAHTGWGVQFIS